MGNQTYITACSGSLRGAWPGKAFLSIRQQIGVMLTTIAPGIERRRSPWSASPIPRPAEPPVRVTVDGEVFDVTTQPDHPGHYHYAWISGPNPGYGFSSASSDGRPCSMVDHEEATPRPDTSNRRFRTGRSNHFTACTRLANSRRVPGWLPAPW